MTPRLRTLLRSIGSFPFRALPNPWRRRLLQAIFDAAQAQPPAAAMRWLLQADSDLTVVVDQAARRYGDGVHVKHRVTGYHDFFVGRIGAGEQVLDVGCGNGAVAYSVATRSGAKVTGIDLEPANIATARKRFRHPALTFVLGDALVELPAGRYEIVILSNVLEHIEDRVGFLRRLVDRLRPRRILIRVPAFERDWRVPVRRELGLFYYSDLGHFTEYTVASLEAEVAAAGLSLAHREVRWGEIWAEATVA